MNGATIYSGGQIYVGSGATAQNVTIYGGYAEIVGGTISTITLDGGALEFYGGLVGTATIESGGTVANNMYYPNYTLASAVVQSGGVFGDAQATTIIVRNGGTAVAQTGSAHITVSSGGLLSASFGVDSGGVVFAGGAAVVTNQGTLDAKTISGTLTQSSGVVLGDVIASGGVFIYSAGAVSGLDLAVGGTIDFATVAYAASATATLNDSDQLMVIGADADSLIGLTGNYAGDSFLLRADATGGTDVILTAADALQATLANDRMLAPHGGIGYNPFSGWAAVSGEANPHPLLGASAPPFDSHSSDAPILHLVTHL